MTENFPKVVSDTKSQIQEAKQTTSKINVRTKIYLGMSFLNYGKVKINKIS